MGLRSVIALDMDYSVCKGLEITPSHGNLGSNLHS